MRRTWFLLLIVFVSVFAVMGVLTFTASANESGVTAVAAPMANDIRISQVYGGGGNTGATYTHDFIELFNSGSSTIDLTGWSVQYASSTGTTWQVTNLSGSIGPGQYYLIQQAQGSGGTTPLPTPDAIGTIAMAGANGKVALVNDTTALSGGCPLGSSVFDFVGYGTANCFEGSGPTAALSNTTAGIRNENGCTDTDDNAADFTIGAPAPRNSSSPAYSCSGAPTVVDTDPQDGDSNVPLDATIAITFSEAVTVTADWFDLTCTTTGPITGATAPAGPAESYVVTPDSLFDYDESCTFTVLADEVTNSGGLTLTADYPFTFTTASLIGDITFIYHDLEDVVQPGESVYLAGNFTGWSPTIPLAANAASSVFSVTVPGMAADTYEYKYVISDTMTIGQQWDWLNTTNRSLTVSGNATVHDYRNVSVGYAKLDWPPTMTGTMGIASDTVYGELYINNVTNPSGEGRGLKAEVGYGSSADLNAWNWFPMAYLEDAGNNDKFDGVFTPNLPGVFSYTVRFDGNWGVGNPNAEWTYGDLTGVGPYPGGDFSLSDTGVITVGFASVPIATARAGSNGEVFGLEGQVIATNNTWNNAPEWAFQDASGGIAAFFLADPPISLGDTVRMVATRGSFNNQEQMVAPLYYFDVVSAGPPVEPITYTTGQVASGVSEGWLIEIEGVVSAMPATCGTAYSVSLNDGSGVAVVRIEAATGINLCSLGIQNGDMLGVVGFSTQFQAGFQVKPRSVADLRLFVDAPVVVGSIPANNAVNVQPDADVFIQFSEPVTVTNNWYALQCSLSGVVAASSAPAGPSDGYTITPDEPFMMGDICHVTVFADQVTNDVGLNLLSDYRASFTVGPALAFGACGEPAVPIGFIQGNGPTTPIFGTTVVVEAVVVGSYQGTGQFSGFFLQSLDDDADDDPMTSEGLFVFHAATPVEVGDLVRVRGTATEFNNLTQLGSVTTGNVVVCDSDVEVTPATMTLPVDDMMEWEAVEGMLVNFAHDLVVTEHYNLGRFGEVMLSVNDRLWNPTNVVPPGAPAQAMQDLNNRSRIFLDDGQNVQNPDPVIFPNPKLTYTNTLRTGALVHNLTGVVDFRSNTYRIQPVGVVDFSETAERPYEADEVGGTLRVASFNVLNYFTTLGTGFNCGPLGTLQCRGADTVFEFERQRIKILNAILEMDADIVGLIEIENNANDDAVIDLVAGLNELAGPDTYDYIPTGPIGTDAIKLAFIYQPATVTPEGDYAILDSNVDPRFLDTRNRPVLIQTFKENATDELVTVAVNHLKSKGSACDDIGDPDVGDGQGNCNLTRLAAVEAMIDYLALDPTNSGSDRFLVIGDLNSYAMEDPIMALVDAGYADMLRQFYGDQAYSYVFDGQFGHLDHALASASLRPLVTGATSWHINADEPRVLDYNAEFKTAGQLVEWFSPEPFRSSDHDPLIVGLDLTYVPPTVTILTPEDGAVFTSTNATAVTIPVIITTTDFVIPDDGHWHLWVNGVDTGPVMDYDTTVDLLPGVHTLSAELRTPEHVSLGVIDTVTVTVNVEYQLLLPLIMNNATGGEAEAAAPTSNVGWLTTLFGLPMLLVGLPLRRRRAG